METVQLAPSMGVEVTAVDLRQVSDSVSLGDLERLFNEESLLLFRDQALSAEEGRRFVGQFGPLVEGIGTVSNETATGRGQLEFHSERSFQKDVPLRGLALQARRVTDVGGATLFVNCVAACRDLPDDLRAELEGVDTLHQFDPRVRLGSAYGEGSEVPEGGWHTTHPAIWQHPVTGVPILYVSPWFTRGIVGMDDGEGSALLSRVFDHLLQPIFRYRHEWHQDDFLLWDNFALLHARESYVESNPRVLSKYEFGLRESVR